MVTKLATRTALALLLIGLAAAPAFGVEYFVSRRGNDTNTGASRDSGFATIQKGLDALSPGDTLTIGPGDYLEGVKRTDLGRLDCNTVIRAEIPGTVTVRGDVAATEFRRLDGCRFVYVSDFEFSGPVPAVNEIDTLTILRRMPNVAELEFNTGAFYHDRQAGKLYVSTSDMQPIESHSYSVSTIATHGVHLICPQRVIVEGLNLTGFSAMELVHYREQTSGGVWGLFIVNGKDCVVRDCRAYLNAWGIGLTSIGEGSGDNLIDRCAAWGNKSTFANGDMGGITAFNARRDTIRRSVAYRNGMYGINIYGTGGALPHSNGDGNTEKNKSLLEQNLAWGNEVADFKIKTGYEYFHVARNCTAPGKWSITNVTDGTIGVSVAAAGPTAKNDILLSDHASLDLSREFADPAHHDYRLQATSRFRRAGIDGRDQGAFAYAPTVFYLSPAGDDQADGLSVAGAWRSFARAVRDLRPGDTLYLEPGDYDAGPALRLIGRADAPIHIRGRGTGTASIRGTLRLNDCQHLGIERVTVRGSIEADKGVSVSLRNVTFVGASTGLTGSDVDELQIGHCEFIGCSVAAVDLKRCANVDLRGNWFQNKAAVAVKVNDFKDVRYSNHNAYHRGTAAWQVSGQTLALAEVGEYHDQQSCEIAVEFADDRSASPSLFAGRGQLGKPIGPYRDEGRRVEIRLVSQPAVHSVSATTANLEWFTSVPATSRLAWGETEACEHSQSFDVNCFGTYSLTGLKPATTYYFRIRSLETPQDLVAEAGHVTVQITDLPIVFKTLPADAAPATYYVATDGDDSRSGVTRNSAWRTLRHAAARVNVGDTVLIAGGKYKERVRIRATGAAGRPISFRALPGERVELDGDGMLLNSGFVSGGKSHLRFDGFYFSNFNLFPNRGWSLQTNGEFHLYHGKDIQITRCFSEGRGGYTAYPVSAFHVEDLVIRNCVNTYKFGGMYFWRCPNLLIEHSVFAEPMIMAFVLRNEKDQKSTMRNCIFTDMLEKKARINLGILCCDGAMDAFRQENNCYFLRDCIPLAERALQGNLTLDRLGPHIAEPLFVDPLFAGDPGATNNPSDKSGFSPDRMMDPGLKLDFDSFFANQPDLRKRRIGLQPEAFDDFDFSARANPSPR